MDYYKFLMEIDKLGFGVSSSNTYHLAGIHYFFLLISEKGDRGRFIKSEFEVNWMPENLYELLDMCKEMKEGE